MICIDGKGEWGFKALKQMVKVWSVIADSDINGESKSSCNMKVLLIDSIDGSDSNGENESSRAKQL